VQATGQLPQQERLAGTEVAAHRDDAAVRPGHPGAQQREQIGVTGRRRDVELGPVVRVGEPRGLTAHEVEQVVTDLELREAGHPYALIEGPAFQRRLGRPPADQHGVPVGLFAPHHRGQETPHHAGVRVAVEDADAAPFAAGRDDQVPVRPVRRALFRERDVRMTGPVRPGHPSQQVGAARVLRFAGSCRRGGRRVVAGQPPVVAVGVRPGPFAAGDPQGTGP
jgi:hypothetical protein